MREKVKDGMREGEIRKGGKNSDKGRGQRDRHRERKKNTLLEIILSGRQKKNMKTQPRKDKKERNKQ